MRNTPYVITVFGAESTGKTTLSRQLATFLGAEWKEEFVRSYLETTGQDVTTFSMRATWQGQKELQQQARQSRQGYVVQDTDLFSTLGYWRLPHVEPVIGPCPEALVSDAIQLQSDVYLIVQSNIPFEPNRIRYGGDKRESPDDYWIELCKHYALPYVVITARGRAARLKEAVAHIAERSLPCVGS